MSSASFSHKISFSFCDGSVPVGLSFSFFMVLLTVSLPTTSGDFPWPQTQSLWPKTVSGYSGRQQLNTHQMKIQALYKLQEESSSPLGTSQDEELTANWRMNPEPSKTENGGATVGIPVIAGPSRQRDKDDEHIDYVNEHCKGKKGGWYAGRTCLSGYSLEKKRKLAGAILQTSQDLKQQPQPTAPPTTVAQSKTTMQDSFDARTAWPNCASIQEIRDQGECGSCWAHAGASAISDRICIASGNANKYFQASVQDPLVCSKGSGSNNLCKGWYTNVPYKQFVESGIVSGGGYQSNSGCMPYTSYTASAAANTSSSSCTSSCSNKSYPKTYKADKTFGKTWYALGNAFVSTPDEAAGNKTSEAVITQIQLELKTRGPLTCQFPVYEDFYNYKSGVYQHITGNLVGGHAVKLVGWGTEGGVDYWLIANSWSKSWGIDGFFKFVRGINHLGIEDYLVTALP